MGISQWQDAEREELEVALKNCGERWATEVKQLQAEIARLREGRQQALVAHAVEKQAKHNLEAENARLRESAAMDGRRLKYLSDERDGMREALEDIRVNGSGRDFDAAARADDALKGSEKGHVHGFSNDPPCCRNALKETT